jgi:hypothetical protein
MLLRLYPAWFRAEYGEEMCAVFASRRQRENPLALWATAVVDIVVNTLRIQTDVLMRDLGWTLRLLRQAPGFTFTAVLVSRSESAGIQQRSRYSTMNCFALCLFPSPRNWLRCTERIS